MKQGIDNMSGEFFAEFRAECTVVPPDEYPRQCPFISDGYRPNLFFGAVSADDCMPNYCIGALSLKKDRLYPGERDEVMIKAIIDDAVRMRLAPGTAFEIREAEHIIAHCVVREVLVLDSKG